MSSKFKAFFTALALCLANRALGFSGERTVIVPFKYTPFPLKPSAASSFFDVDQNGRRGHTNLAGIVYWEDVNYKDNRVLLSISPLFSPTQHPTIVVYLHGNLSTLERDVRGRQQIPRQFLDSGMNGILVAPQFAVDAADSSVGHFGDAGFFTRFLDEVADHVSDWQANPRYTDYLKKAPVVLVAYSGGYRAAAKLLEQPENVNRIKGVVLLDGLYAFENTFADWIEANRKQVFFFSSYTEGAASNNNLLQELLTNRRISFEKSLPHTITAGTLSFLSLENEKDHFNFVNNAWTDNPLRDLLERIKISY